MRLPSEAGPSGWKVAPLSEVAEIASGVAKGRKLDGQKTVSVPYLRVANVQAGSLDLSEVKNIDVLQEEADRLRLQDGDVLMTEGGDPDKLGRGTVWRSQIPVCIHQNHVFRVRTDSRHLVPDYLSRYLSSPQARAYFLRCAKQTTGIASINKTQLSAFPVELPPLAEQRRIASILDHADALRAKRRQALAKLDELTQAMFLEMFGDPAANTKKWPTTLVRDLVHSLRNGVSPSNSGSVEARVLTLSAITRGKFDEAAWKSSTFQVAPPADQQVSDADFLICRGNGNVNLVGVGCFPPRSMPGMTFPDTMIAGRFSEEKLARSFLQILWNSSATRKQIESLARTTNGTFKINQTMIESITLITPPLDLQRQFAARVAQVDRLKAAHRASLAKLDALFASLQHRAFRGEL